MRAAGLLGVLAVLIFPANPAHAFEFRFGGDFSARALTAQAEDPAPHPLNGEGSGFELVANLPLKTGSLPAASDIELHGDYAFIGSYTEGMVIADISDPTKPRRIGTFACGGGSQYDVQLDVELEYAVLSVDNRNATCFPRNAETGATQEGSLIIDLSDLTNPTLLSAIPMPFGSHTQTLDGDVLYVNNYPTGYHKLEVFDLRDPAQPRRIGQLDFGAGQASVHDLMIDHRGDGKVLAYAASIANTDVIDVTNPRSPFLVQRISDPTVSISHQAEPNFSGNTLIVTDEYSGGAEEPECGRDPASTGQGGGAEATLLNTGAIHFYRLAGDGTIANNGATTATSSGKYGTFNIPKQANAVGGCTVHVFWQAPDENRLVTAWYGRGIRLVDFADPAAAREVAYFIPSGADVWAAKPHRGYVFTGDINRGMDVLRYTGEQGQRWPATAGAMEVQRRAYQANHDNPPDLDPVPDPGAIPPANDPPAGSSGSDRQAGDPGYASDAPPSGGAQEEVSLDAPSPPAEPGKRTLAGGRWSALFKVPGRPGRSRKLSVTFVDQAQTVSTKLVFRARAGRTRKLRGLLAGQPGKYRYVVRLGARGRPLHMGRVTIRKGSKSPFKVRPGRSLVCRLL